MPLAFLPAFGWLIGLPLSALLFLRIENAWSQASLVLGLVSAVPLLSLLVFPSGDSVVFLASLGITQLLAFIGILLGVNALRRPGKALDALNFGLTLNVMALFFPAALLIAHIAIED